MFMRGLSGCRPASSISKTKYHVEAMEPETEEAAIALNTCRTAKSVSETIHPKWVVAGQGNLAIVRDWLIDALGAGCHRQRRAQEYCGQGSQDNSTWGSWSVSLGRAFFACRRIRNKDMYKRKITLQCT